MHQNYFNLVLIRRFLDFKNAHKFIFEVGSVLIISRENLLEFRNSSDFVIYH